MVETSDTIDPQVVQLNPSYKNLDIIVINGVARYPGDLNSTFKSNPQLSGFANLTQSIYIPYWDTGDNTNSNASISQVLSGVRGLTLFVPENGTFTREISQFSSNQTALLDVLRNHVINGTTLYTPSFLNSSHTSAAGEQFSFTTNSTGSYVTSLNITARVIQPDVLISNGVIHIIDRVLTNTQVNETAAKDAYYSDSSIAGYSSTETGPVGVPTGRTSMLSVNGARTNSDDFRNCFLAVLSVTLGYSYFLFA